VLGRVKRWVLAVLAMLARPRSFGGSPCPTLSARCAWLRAAPVPPREERGAFDPPCDSVAHLEVSGREASLDIDARSPRGVEQEAGFTCEHVNLLGKEHANMLTSGQLHVNMRYI